MNKKFKCWAVCLKSFGKTLNHKWAITEKIAFYCVKNTWIYKLQWIKYILNVCFKKFWGKRWITSGQSKRKYRQLMFNTIASNYFRPFFTWEVFLKDIFSMFFVVFISSQTPMANNMYLYNVNWYDIRKNQARTNSSKFLKRGKCGSLRAWQIDLIKKWKIWT